MKATNSARAPAPTPSAPAPSATPATLAEEQAKAQAAFLKQQAERAQMATNKSQRELYVGNLIPHVVTREHLSRFFNESLAAVFPNKQGKDLQPVVHLNMHTGGKYCFVELRDVDMATVALDLNGMTLLGCTLNIGRPSNYAKNN
jgi:splicing factor U2AF subunit